MWTSERSGTRHLCVYGLNGEEQRTLTEGRLEGPVERVVAVDETRGRVFLTAHGDPKDPRTEQLYRVDLEGGEARHRCDGPVIKMVDLGPDGASLAVFRGGLLSLLQAQKRVARVPR